MANPNKDDANQNQHNHKAAAAGGTGAHRPDIETIEGVDAPENVGGERPNESNTGSAKGETGERLDLRDADERH